MMEEQPMTGNILLLGSGLVTEPLVEYLLKLDDVRLTIATLEEDKARAMVKGNQKADVVYMDAGNQEDLDSRVRDYDLVISLLPAPMHPGVARSCLKHRKNMLTASYVSPAMKTFDDDARDAGLLFLNELGLDPGIDHMSAMRIIEHVENSGGTITGFRSYCGGLPAPEANTNPLGYKFSWAPRGVLSAATNDARYLWNGAISDVAGKDLFRSFESLAVQDLIFEAYPNRNSMPYIDLYGLRNADTMFRGTLRYPGWCRAFRALVDAGYLDQTERRLSVKTYAELARLLAGDRPGDPRALMAEKTGLPPSDPAIETMRWLGLFSEDPLYPGEKTILDQLARKCLEKMQYEPLERDMVVLHHIFQARFGDTDRTITSTLIDYGIPGGHSAMARTVSLPVAIGAKLIIQRKISLTGVQIPVAECIYKPVLHELESLGIRCNEKGL